MIPPGGEGLEVRFSRLSSQRSEPTNGPIVHDELLGKLLAILDEPDSRHVCQAAKNDLDYFVTRDHETILKHAEEVHAAAGIKAVLPSQLAAELAARELSSE